MLYRNFACKKAIYKCYKVCDNLARQEYVKGLTIGIKYTKASIWRLEEKHNDLLYCSKKGITEEITDLAGCMVNATNAIVTPQENEGFLDGMTLVIKAYNYLVEYEVLYQIGLLSEASRNKIIQPK